MASETEICNRALQKVGARRITSLSEDSVNARACALAFPKVRDAELQKHPWSFAIQRFSLAEDGTPPAFGRARSFTLPTDHIRLLAPYPEQNLADRDWIVEGKKVVTNEGSPLNVRCVMRITDVNLWHPLFQESVSAKIAMEICEELTQSNAKKESAREDYKEAVREAKKASAIENVPAESPDSSWITGRS